jgi:hypothetical protein
MPLFIMMIKYFNRTTHFLLFFALLSPNVSATEYIVYGEGTEGHLWWDCQVSFCSISEYDPLTCNYISSTTLPLGDYYWLGTLTTFVCVDGEWRQLCSSPSWYFNYRPDFVSDNPGGQQCNCDEQEAAATADSSCGEAEWHWVDQETCEWECDDQCPDDPDKTEPGICGCGVPDTDSDGDGTPDCNDNCPGDPNKTEPGVCGCGIPDTDSDGDGTPDCNDNCPSDPNKTEPSVCGCGVLDTDSDGDGTLDCDDNCPNDSNKTEQGICGCDVPDTDSDGDGTPDCNDNCPDDPAKTEPGVCGCGVADTDSDGDGTPDCNDNCPSDPNKTEPGICGCEVPDTDSDGDGIPDCMDIDDEDNFGDGGGDNNRDC